MADEVKDDVLWGVQAIADEIGRTDRQTYHMLASGSLPGRKVGGHWVCSRKVLRAFFERPSGPVEHAAA